MARLLEEAHDEVLVRRQHLGKAVGRLHERNLVGLGESPQVGGAQEAVSDPHGPCHLARDGDVVPGEHERADAVGANAGDELRGVLARRVRESE